MAEMIAPSILSANFAVLGQEIESVARHSRYIHYDVMDGHFVPNISFGYSILRSAKQAFPGAEYDVHLMVTHPGQWISHFHEAGASIITVHFESQEFRTTSGPYPEEGDVQAVIQHCKDIAQRIRGLGIKAGISIKPQTPVAVLGPLLEHFDLVLIMSVEPGFGGQKYIPECAEKARWLVQEKYTGIIEIDGGIDGTTVKHAKNCGVQLFVAGSYIFSVTGDERARRIDSITK